MRRSIMVSGVAMLAAATFAGCGGSSSSASRTYQPPTTTTSAATTSSPTTTTSANPYTQTPFPVVVPQYDLGSTAGITQALDGYYVQQAQQSAGNENAPVNGYCGAVRVPGMVGDVPEQVAKMVDGNLGVYYCLNGTGCTLMYVDLGSGHVYQGSACNGGSTGNSGNTGSGNSGNSGNTGNTGMTTVPGAVASSPPSMNVDPSTWFGYDQATRLALVKGYLAENPSCDAVDGGAGPTAEDLLAGINETLTPGTLVTPEQYADTFCAAYNAANAALN